MERGEVVWEPASGAWERSRLAAFARRSGFEPTPGDYPTLLRASLDDPVTFWGAFASWIGLQWHDPPGGVVDGTLGGRVTWFPGGTLNAAEHLLEPAAAATTSPVDSSDLAVIGRSDHRPRRTLTWAELRGEVARVRRGLIELGVGRGDRVAACLPNVPETVVAFLATASLGAVWTSAAPEFGVRAVVDRWSQLDPIVVLAVDGYRYGARTIERSDEITEIVDALPTVRHLVVLPLLDRGDPRPRCRTGVAVHSWNELRAVPGELAFEAVPVDHPLYVLFSSGTTGLPKPIVHGHGGITVEHLKVMALHHDLGRGNRAFWFSTTGWMMWNYLVGALGVGATIVLFDGDPAWPDLSTLWSLAADEHVELFGVSAPFLMACRKAGLTPGSSFDLSSLRQVGSTGAPLPADGFRWIRDAVGPQVQPCSVSGGTDVCTAFVGSAPSVAVRAGEISVRMLGCDVQAFTPDGTPCESGTTGELVITSPLPSMPIGLWGDTTGERLRRTYFETFPGVWHHGDWITFHDDGACEITGRSDATLNRGGVRLGTSDFYRVVEAMPEVADSLVVHLEDRDGGPGELLLMVSCAPGHRLDDRLHRAIVTALRSELSPRHVPDEIHEIAAVPRTLSGKKLEVPIKRVLLGQRSTEVASRGSLADPAAYDAVVTWAEARRTAAASRREPGAASDAR
jgi:acetoacetyl-CoA synthetase